MCDSIEGKNTGWDDHVAAWDPSWSLTYDRDIGGYIDTTEQNEQYLIVTPSGLQSLKPSNQSSSTYSKTIGALWSRLEDDKRTAFVKILLESGLKAVATFKAVLATFLDDQFDVLADVFNYVSIPRLRAYIELLALTKIKKSVSQQTPSDECRQDTSDSSNISTTSSELPCLIQAIHDLPREIFDMIEVETFHQAFVPGYLFPDHTTNNDGMFTFKHKSYEAANPPAFLALRPAMLSKYRDAYWTDNTWVIGQGHPHDTVEFLDRMGDLSMRIKKVYLAFSVDDVLGGSQLFQETIESIQSDSDDVEIANVRGLGRYASRCDSIATELVGLWWKKFAAVCWLDLVDLTLDLREAYGPNDVYIPQSCCLRTLPRFQHGVPTKFTILARIPELVTEALDAITAIN